MMLYIHIPFCIKKCGYCDFLSFAKKASYWEPYVTALCNELRERAVSTPLTSIYLGGGTPTVLSTKQLGAILDTIYANYQVAADAEITLECNPATVTKDSAGELSLLSINRISIGLQSANEDELRLLGRAHNLSDFRATYEAFLKAGIDNINVDIMTGIPKQTLESMQNTLKNVLSLRPAHISTYSLTLEPGTIFASIYEKGRYPLPTDDAEFEIYKETIDTLIAHKYERYEISNYSKPGKASRHNLGYWDRLPYIGAGLGASSFYDHTRYKNFTDLDKYIGLYNSPSITIDDDCFEEVIPLTKRDEIAEFMYLGLRKLSGVSMADFEDAFGERMDSYYFRVLERLEQEGLIIKSFGNVRIADHAIETSNQILWEFLPDE